MLNSIIICLKMLNIERHATGDSDIILQSWRAITIAPLEIQDMKLASVLF